MNIYCLDVAIGADPINLWPFLPTLVIIILLEAVIMFLFKVNNFSRVLLGSAIVNIVSTLIGFLLITKLGEFGEKTASWREWLIFYGETVFIEGLLMMLLFIKVHKGKLWLATFAMNLVSYLFLYLVKN